MKKAILFSSIAMLSLQALGDISLVRTQTCVPQTPEDKIIYNEDFSWDETLNQILQRAQRLYIADKRLDQRAYINEDKQIVFPMKMFSGETKEVKLTDKFIKSVRLHVEQALKRKYVDAIIFSDMGHSHFFIPQSYYDNELEDFPIHGNHLFYEKNARS